jgi:hypothetical protein
LPGLHQQLCYEFGVCVSLVVNHLYSRFSHLTGMHVKHHVAFSGPRTPKWQCFFQCHLFSDWHSSKLHTSRLHMSPATQQFKKKLLSVIFFYHILPLCSPMHLRWRSLMSILQHSPTHWSHPSSGHLIGVASLHGGPRLTQSRQSVVSRSCCLQHPHSHYHLITVQAYQTHMRDRDSCITFIRFGFAGLHRSLAVSGIVKSLTIAPLMSLLLTPVLGVCVIAKSSFGDVGQHSPCLAPPSGWYENGTR